METIESRKPVGAGDIAPAVTLSAPERPGGLLLEQVDQRSWDRGRRLSRGGAG